MEEGTSVLRTLYRNYLLCLNKQIRTSTNPLRPAAINVPLIILKCFRKEDVPPTYKNHVALIPVHNSDTTPITKLAACTSWSFPPKTYGRSSYVGVHRGGRFSHTTQEYLKNIPCQLFLPSPHLKLRSIFDLAWVLEFAWVSTWIILRCQCNSIAIPNSHK